MEGGNEAYRDGEVVGEGDERPRRDGPAFELPVFREIWRCLVLCWDPEVCLNRAIPTFVVDFLEGSGGGGGARTEVFVDEEVGVLTRFNGRLLRELP